MDKILSTFSEQNTIIFKEKFKQALTENINLIPDKTELGTLLGEYTAHYENTQFNRFTISQNIFEEYIYALGYIGYPNRDICLPFITSYLNNTDAELPDFDWILYLTFSKEWTDIYTQITNLRQVPLYDIIEQIFYTKINHWNNLFTYILPTLFSLIDITLIPESEQAKILQRIVIVYTPNLNYTTEVLDTFIKNGFNLNVKNEEGFPFWVFLVMHYVNNQNYNFATILLSHINPNIDLLTPIQLADKQHSSPALHYIVAKYCNTPPVLDIIIELLEKTDRNILFTKDSWGRNILHSYVIAIHNKLMEHNPLTPLPFDYVHQLLSHYFINYLLDIGFDLNEPIIINNLKEVISVKIKGNLPKEYGKTARQIIDECYSKTHC